MTLAFGWVPAGADDLTQFDVKRAPWPCFRGPYGNGSAPKLGLKLVDDLANAKLVWESEEKLPPGTPWPGPWRKRPTAWKGGNIKKAPWQQRAWSGGYCPPIVAEDKVFVGCWRVAGRKDWSWLDEKDRQKSRKGQTADDLLYCFDAATGKQLWCAVQAGKGQSLPGYGKDAWMIIAWWDGAVFVPGTGKQLYAVDATNGKLLWQAPIPYRTKPGKGWSALTAAAAVSGGVVVCGEDSLGAWDCATGEDLWQGVGKRPYCVPVPWQHGAKAYFIVSGKLIEARTGKVCWEIPDPSESSTGDSVHGEYLVMSNRDWESTEHPMRGMSCFRISPEKYEELWHEAWHVKTRHCARITTTVIFDNRVVGRTRDGKTWGDCGMCSLDLATGRRCGEPVKGVPLGYGPLVAEGRVIGNHEEAVGYGGIDATGALRKLMNAGDNGWTIAQCTDAAYANGFLYFRRTKSDGHARMVCYDLRKSAQNDD